MRAITKIRARIERFKRHPLDTKTNLINFVLAVMLAIYTVKSSCSDDEVKGHMKYLATRQVSLDSTLVELQRQQNKTGLDIKHFDSLLYKIDTLLNKQNDLIGLTGAQIDTFVLLNKMISKQYRMNRMVFMKSQHDELLKKFNAYNDLMISMIDMESEISIFRDQKLGTHIIGMPSVTERLRRMNALIPIIKTMHNAELLIPRRNIGTKWDKCVTHLVQLKGVYTSNINRGFLIDSTNEGWPLFCQLMYDVVELNDTIAFYSQEGRDSTQKYINLYANEMYKP